MDISKRRIATLTFVVCVALIVLFNLSMCWLSGCALWHKILVALISVCGIGVLPIMVMKFDFAYNIAASIYIGFASRAKWIVGNKITVTRDAGVCLISFVVIYIAEKAAGNGNINIWRVYFWSGIVTLIVCWYEILKRYKTIKVESAFAIIAFVLGLTTILSSPRHVAAVPDDEIHWGRAASLVSVFDSVKYDSENIMYYTTIDQFYKILNHEYTYEDMHNYDESLNELYGHEHAMVADVLNRDDTVGYDTHLGTYSIAYVAPAIGMIIAKGLHLPYTCILIAGKLGILLSYIAIIYGAIRRLRYGKVLVSTIALMPTPLYWASSYTYDWWVLAWSIYAYSVFISMFKNPDEKASNKDLIVMIVTLGLAIIPKWVYGVLFIPFLFMPGYKFKSRKQRLIYYAFFAVSAICAWVLLINPLLHGGLGVGDVRGGADVNATVQLWGIMMFPWNYVKVLFKFMLGYINPINGESYLTNMGFWGVSSCSIVMALMLLVIACVDRSPYKVVEKKRVVAYSVLKVVTLCTCLLGVAVIATSLYIGFTPIFAHTINGCQPRYILPLLMPFLYSIGVDGTIIACKINRKKLAMSVLMLSTLVYVLSYWQVYMSNL